MRQLNLLERGVYPATAVVHWLDGTSNFDPSLMARITAPLDVRFDTPLPGDLKRHRRIYRFYANAVALRSGSRAKGGLLRNAR